MNVINCDNCHNEPNQLYLFSNIVDTGVYTLCWHCAVKWGKFSGTSKKKMIDETIRDYEKELTEMFMEKLELISMYIDEGK